MINTDYYFFSFLFLIYIFSPFLPSLTHSFLPSFLFTSVPLFFFSLEYLPESYFGKNQSSWASFFSEIKTLCLRQYSVCQRIYSFLQPMFVSNFSFCDWLLSHFTIFFIEVLVTILYQQSILFIFGLHEFYYNSFGHNFIWVYPVRCFQSFLNL